MDLLDETRSLMPGRGRPHWQLEQKSEDALMHAHKKAGAAIHKVLGGKYGPIGSGWSTSAGWEVKDKLMHLEVGGNWVPRPGVYFVYFRVVGPSFDKTPTLNTLLRHSKKLMDRKLGKILGRFGSYKKAQIGNGIAVVGVNVPEDKIEDLVKRLPHIARSWAQDMKALGAASAAKVLEDIEDSEEGLEEAVTDNKLRAAIWKRTPTDSRSGKKRDKSREIMMTGQAAKEYGVKRYTILKIDELEGEKLRKLARAVGAIAEDLEEGVQFIHPYAAGFWVVKVEDYLHKFTGKQWRFDKNLVKDGNRARYRWKGKGKPRGALFQPMFVMYLEYDKGKDLFDVETQFVDHEGHVIGSKTLHGLYTDQVTKPDVLFGWAARKWKKKTGLKAEGVTGPTRMQVQDYVDKQIRVGKSARQAAMAAEKAFKLKRVQLNSKHQVVQMETIAGAPMPFLGDQGFADWKDEIKQQIRAPSWTYPDWALPKEDLEEAMDPKKFAQAQSLARLLKKAGTSAADAQDRIQKKYDLSDHELKAVLASIWGRRGR